MRYASAETWYTVLFIVLATIAPIFVGIAVFKIYRLFFPLPPVEDDEIFDIDAHIGDSFLKMLMTGWAICLPIYLWIYYSGVLY